VQTERSETAAGKWDDCNSAWAETLEELSEVRQFSMRSHQSDLCEAVFHEVAHLLWIAERSHTYYGI
jgi:hypothetical protein